MANAITWIAHILYTQDIISLLNRYFHNPNSVMKDKLIYLCSTFISKKGLCIMIETSGDHFTHHIWPGRTLWSEHNHIQWMWHFMFVTWQVFFWAIHITELKITAFFCEIQAGGGKTVFMGKGQVNSIFQLFITLLWIFQVTFVCSPSSKFLRSVFLPNYSLVTQVIIRHLFRE